MNDTDRDVNAHTEPIVLDVEECQDCGIFVLAEDLDALGLVSGLPRRAGVRGLPGVDWP